MGVNGLLPCLQSITRTVSLEHYRGLTVAIDAMSWLHKGVFACDVKALARSQRIDSEKCGSAELRCVKYALDKAVILRRKFGMEVLLVIDGDSLPSKKEENAQRREDREICFDKAVAAENAGDARAARRFYAASISVTHKIRYELINACKQAKIPFLVAPYEADAQMARLAHTGVVDLVVTEDSDILAYGCPRALFKVDFEACKGQEIQLMRDLGENKSLSFKNWTHDMFVFMCILSGCDYCRGVPGIGIKLAHKLVRVHRSPSKIFSALRTADRMPMNFEDDFWVAFRTFRHQRVFCPSRRQIEPLFPIPGSSHNSSPKKVWPFLGEYIEPHIASRIADGTLHPSKKIEWDEALKSVRDIEINYRSSSSNAERKQPRESTSQKENTWHSLVYGDGGSEHKSPRLDHNDVSTTNLAVSDRDMFRFFSRNSNCHRDDVRPPLKEIYVNGNTESGDSTQTMIADTMPPPPGHKDLPIHFHEYKSLLVGDTFKPMSRKRIKRMNDGTKSTECVHRIWVKSSRTPVHLFPDDLDDTVFETGPNAGGGGIPSFAKRNNPLARAPCPPSTHDCGFVSFAGRSRDEMNGCLYPTNETSVYGNCLLIAHSHIHSHGHSYESITCNQSDGNEFSYFRQHDGKYQIHQENDCDDASFSRRHYDVSRFGDHLSAPDDDSSSRRYYEKCRNGNQQDVCDEASYDKTCQRDLNSSRRHDLKSSSSGYTTAEERHTNECAEHEYSAFSTELESIYGESRDFDFDHSFQSVGAVESEQSHQRKKNYDDRTNAYENIGGFQLFEGYNENEQSDEHLCIEFDDNTNKHNHSFDVDYDNVSYEGRGANHRISNVSLFDDGLLMAIEEMQQL
ncbi:hypothetical protein ACHAW6_010102 [Cyclotella cf. meneghiniana]